MGRPGQACDARAFCPSVGHRAALLLSAAVASLVLAAGLVAGCDDQDSGEPAGESAAAKHTMNFRVDPALLGPSQRFEEFDIELSPPAGWTALPDEQFAAVAAGVDGRAAGSGASTNPAAGAEASPSDPAAASDKFEAIPLAVYGQADKNLWLIVSSVKVPEPALYTAALRERPEKVESTDFYVHGIHVHQYRVLPAGLVNFKLLLSAPGHENARRLQLDFLIPRQQYESLARTVESSLGSLKPLKRTSV